MKGLILVLFLVVAGVVGLGFYLGWFQISSGSVGSKDNITLSVNRDTIEDDKDEAVDKLRDLGEKDAPATTTPVEAED